MAQHFTRDSDNYQRAVCITIFFYLHTADAQLTQKRYALTSESSINRPRRDDDLPSFAGIGKWVKQTFLDRVNTSIRKFNAALMTSLWQCFRSMRCKLSSICFAELQKKLQQVNNEYFLCRHYSSFDMVHKMRRDSQTKTVHSNRLKQRKRKKERKICSILT